MNIKTNLLEDYVNFVDTTKKQKTNTSKIYNFFCGYFMFVFIFSFIQISK